jgi:hypothetical protein
MFKVLSLIPGTTKNKNKKRKYFINTGSSKGDFPHKG